MLFAIKKYTYTCEEKRSVSFSKALATAVLIFASFYGNAQPSLTSLAQELEKNKKEDTTEVKLLKDLAWEYMFSNPDTSLILAKKALDISTKLNWWLGIGLSNVEIGWYYYIKGDFEKAIRYEKIAETLFNKFVNSKEKKIARDAKKGKAYALSNTGSIYASQANHVKALSYFLESLKLYEEIKNERNIASLLLNIGGLYTQTNDIDKGLYYFERVIKIGEKQKNPALLIPGYINLGVLYSEKALYQKSLEYFEKGLELARQTNQQRNEAIALSGIGIVYERLSEFEKALVYHENARKIQETLGDGYGLAQEIMALGAIYLHLKRYNEAERYLLQSKPLVEANGSDLLKRDLHKHFYMLFRDQKQHTKALEAYKKHIEIRDKITNDENVREQARMGMQYEFDKKQAADSVKTALRLAEEHRAHTQRIQRQKLYTYAGIAGFLIMLVFAFIALRAYRNKQKANKIIAEQKLMVEIKQKEVLDSIYYAKRIQQALLPSDKSIDRQLNNLKRS
ncbi:MAG TPA: tetratricopeptide repeat protein [Flavobacteriales bacterium]|nr:tetratricopeptide repeat protein [Flavobacteriales bacterium]